MGAVARVRLAFHMLTFTNKISLITILVNTIFASMSHIVPVPSWPQRRPHARGDINPFYELGPFSIYVLRPHETIVLHRKDMLHAHNCLFLPWPLLVTSVTDFCYIIFYKMWLTEIIQMWWIRRCLWLLQFSLRVKLHNKFSIYFAIVHWKSVMLR